ncbi:MAG: tripartite tricarboxylate transporter substrate binding protein [Burkholderiales bacterium]|nr:tripartite tricarboxylate transporter substrate binding protein [Burkholderiales bacterium]
MRRHMLGILALGTAALLAQPAWAAYPEKPIEIVIPWPPGTETDVGTRVLAAAMSKRLKVPVQVINKPGAGGVIGITDFVKSRPDGYTLAQGNVGPLVSQVVAGNTTYGMGDVEPIGLFNTQPYLLVGRGDAPYKNMQELAAFAKGSAKELAIGNFGPATVPTLSVNRMAIASGWKFKGVVFPQTNFSQIQSGDVDLIVVAYPVVAAQIRSGQARALVAMSPKRINVLPDTPTTREAGFDFDVSIWSGLFAPKGTPGEVLKLLTETLRDALNDPSVRDFEQKSGILHGYIDPAATRRQMESEANGLRPVMTTLGLVKK